MTLPLALLGTLLAVAASADVAQRRVPNLVVALLAAAGLAVQGAAGGARGLAGGVLAGAVVLVAFFYPWASGKLGAGDVKLAAAAAIWVGPGDLLTFLLVAGAAGIPVAAAARLSHRVASRRLLATLSARGLGVEAALPPRETAPLAVAIAVAALLVVHGGVR